MLLKTQQGLSGQIFLGFCVQHSFPLTMGQAPSSPDKLELGIRKGLKSKHLPHS